MAETDQLASQMRKTGLTKAYFSTLLLSPIAYYAIMTKNITIKNSLVIPTILSTLTIHFLFSRILFVNITEERNLKKFIEESRRGAH